MVRMYATGRIDGVSSTSTASTEMRPDVVRKLAAKRR